MKKFLFLSILALSLSAQADDYTVTFSGKTTSSITATVTGTEGADAIDSAAWVSAGSTQFKTAGANSAAVIDSALTPNANVGTGGTWTESFSFNATTNVALSSLSMSVVLYGAGGPQSTSATRGATFTFTVLAADGTTELGSATNTHTYTGTGDATASGTQTLEFATPVAIPKGTFSIKIVCNSGTGGGCFFGLYNFIMSVSGTNFRRLYTDLQHYYSFNEKNAAITDTPGLKIPDYEWNGSALTMKTTDFLGIAPTAVGDFFTKTPNVTRKFENDLCVSGAGASARVEGVKVDTLKPADASPWSLSSWFLWGSGENTIANYSILLANGAYTGTARGTSETADSVISTNATYNRGWCLSRFGVSGTTHRVAFRCFYTTDDGTTRTLVTVLSNDDATGKVSKGSWANVIMTLTANADNTRTFKMYINGVAQTATAILPANAVVEAPDSTLTTWQHAVTTSVGNAQGQTGVDEIATWNRVLSANEIRAIATGTDPISVMIDMDLDTTPLVESYLVFGPNSGPTMSVGVVSKYCYNRLDASTAVDQPSMLTQMNGSSTILRVQTYAGTTVTGFPTNFTAAVEEETVSALFKSMSGGAIISTAAGNFLSMNNCVSGQKYQATFLFASGIQTLPAATISAEGLSSATWSPVYYAGTAPTATSDGITVTVDGSNGTATQWALVQVAFTATADKVTFMSTGATSLYGAKFYLENPAARPTYTYGNWNAYTSVTNWTADTAWSIDGNAHTAYVEGKSAMFAAPSTNTITRSVVFVNGNSAPDVRVETGTYYSYTFEGTGLGLTGHGGVTKTGASSLNFNGTNTFTGPLVVNRGGVVVRGQIQPARIDAPTSPAAGDVVAILAPETVSEYTLCSDITGALPFDKRGVGTLILTGNSTYTAATVVHQGTLRVNGSHRGGGAYTVRSGAYLGGSGVVASAVTVNAGTLRSGLETGLTLTSNATLTSGTQPAEFRLKANFDADGTFIPLDVQGTLTTPSAGFYLTCPSEELIQLPRDQGDVVIVKAKNWTATTKTLNESDAAALARQGWSVVVDASSTPKTISLRSTAAVPADVTFTDPDETEMTADEKMFIEVAFAATNAVETLPPKIRVEAKGFERGQSVTKTGAEAATAVNLLGITPEFSQNPGDATTTDAKIEYVFGITEISIDGAGQVTLKVQAQAQKGTRGAGIHGTAKVYSIQGDLVLPIHGTAKVNPAYEDNNGYLTFTFTPTAEQTIFLVKVTE